nr:hypothetical protein [Variovorax sp. MHTC-1]
MMFVPAATDVRVLPLWMVSALELDAVVPIVRMPIVAVAGPETPSTEGFGVLVLIVTSPVGTVPADQLLPTVQSLLVVPVHVCALAGDDQPQRAAATTPTPASSAWHRRVSLPLLPRCAADSEATTQVPRALDQTMRNTWFI